MTDDADKIARHIKKIRAAVAPGQRIVFISGNFNVIHPGHLRIINFAANCGDYLVVGVNADSLGAALIGEELRRESVAAIGVVDYALILTIPAEEFIARLKPTVVVKGREHRKSVNPEKAAVDAYGGKLLFGSGDARFSSLDLLRRELQDANLVTIRQPADYPRRRGFKPADLIPIVEKFSRLRVVVVGDLIVDEYIDCDPLGMSREDPTLVVMPIDTELFIGGAGIVAAHACGMGAQVSYFAVAGDDQGARYSGEKLTSYGVALQLALDDTRPTTVKQRYRAHDKTLLRVSRLRQHDINADIDKAMYGQIVSALEHADLMIFADFNYGCLPQPLVDRIVEFCRERDIPMVADSQASSQIGDVSRFRNMLLVTPTEHEARLAMQDFQSGLVTLADALREKGKARHVIITLGAEGILIHSPEEPKGLITDQLPAFNLAPKDVSGAGDCLLTCAAMALTAGADIWESAYLGSLAAACQVSRVGNTPLTAKELIAELNQ